MIWKSHVGKITPHVCRHTFCSNMAKSGMNPKTLQYIMGHSDIGVTLNTYTHFSIDDAKEEDGKNLCKCLINTELYGAMNLQLVYNFCRQKYADFCKDMPNSYKITMCSRPHG